VTKGDQRGFRRFVPSNFALIQQGPPPMAVLDNAQQASF
jgi:hypothetical protein